MDSQLSYFTFSRDFGPREQLKNFARVVLIWCPLVTTLFTIGFGGTDKFFIKFSLSMIIAVTVASFCFVGSWTLNYLYNSYRRRKGIPIPKEALFSGMTTSFPFLIPGLYVGFKFAGLFSVFIGRPWSQPSFQDYRSGVIFGILVSSFFTLFQVVRQFKEAKQESELRLRELENEKLKAQVSALSAQMNPHLLFNSLNTIASTIITDPRSAEDMIVQLSELYRGILKSAKGDMHSLENELLLCRSYLEIERKRFGPRINYQIQIDEDLDPLTISIPVLLLQPLVENAVKHGLSPQREGGHILISIRRESMNLVLEVIDDGIGLNSGRTSQGTGTGVSNCASRVRLKYGPDSNFTFGRHEDKKTRAAISIPLQEAIADASPSY